MARPAPKKDAADSTDVNTWHALLAVDALSPPWAFLWETTAKTMPDVRPKEARPKPVFTAAKAAASEGDTKFHTACVAAVRYL